jgi:uncharacterized membrane protein YfcA
VRRDRRSQRQLRLASSRTELVRTDDSALHWGSCVAIGVLAGFLSALLGIGGGVIVASLLILLVGFSSRRAVGTSLAAMLFTLPVGVLALTSIDAVRWRAAALIGAPALVGMLCGTWLGRRYSSRALGAAFGIFLVLNAIHLVLQ